MPAERFNRTEFSRLGTSQPRGGGKPSTWPQGQRTPCCEGRGGCPVVRPHSGPEEQGRDFPALTGTSLPKDLLLGPLWTDGAPDSGWLPGGPLRSRAACDLLP